MCGVSADLKKIFEFQLTKMNNLTVQASTPQHFPNPKHNYLRTTWRKSIARPCLDLIVF